MVTIEFNLDLLPAVPVTHVGDLRGATNYKMECIRIELISSICSLENEFFSIFHTVDTSMLEYYLCV